VKARPRSSGGATAAFIGFLVRSYPRETLRTSVLITLSTLAEALGVMTIVPTLHAAAYGEQAPGADNVFGRSVATLLASVGLPVTLLTLVPIVVVCMIGKGLFQWLAWRAGGHAMARIATDLRLRLVGNLFAARWPFFVQQPLGALATAVGHESYATAHAYLATCQLFASASLALVYVLVIAVVSLPALPLTLLIGVALAAPVAIILRRVRTIAAGDARAQQSVVTNLLNAIGSIKPIRAMGGEEGFAALARADADVLRSSIARQVSMTYLMPAAQEPILVVGIAIFLAASSYFVQDFPTMAVIVFALWRCGAHLTFANRAYRELVVAEPHYWQLQKMLDASHEARESEGSGGEVPGGPLAIDLRDVVFAHGAERILDGLSMHVPAGSITAIVGESGVGKTTVIDLLSMLYQPTSGHILVNGMPLAEISVRAWRRRLGYVPQETTLFHGTVVENVTMGAADVSVDDVRAALTAAGAWEFVEGLERGMDTIVGERGSRLSGGQRQRIALARALARKPVLLLLDEVTASLDPAAEAAVIAAIRALTPRTTVVLATHQPTLIAIADSVYRLHNRSSGCGVAELLATSKAR